MVMSEKRCHGKNKRFLGYCDRKPSVVREGVDYCWQHDPERLSRVVKENRQKRKVEMAERETKVDAEIHQRQLRRQAGVDALSEADLLTIIRLGGILSMIALLTGK
jgi:hypothetical protein